MSPYREAAFLDDEPESSPGGRRWVVLTPQFWTRRRILTGVVLLGLLLRLWAAWQLPVDADEPVYLRAGYDYARFIQVGNWGAVIDYTGNQEHPPLVKLLYGLTILALGRNATLESALFFSRLISVLFGTLGVWLVALLDPLAGAVLAVQTLLVKYTSEAYLEALPLFASLAAIFALLRSGGGRDRWFWLSAAGLGLAAAGKFSYFPILLVVLYIYWEKKLPWNRLSLYLGLAAITFWVLDPALWRQPIQRLVAALSFHVQYSQGAHVQEVGYPWYQPFIWVSRSMASQWHPAVFFYYGFDGWIFLLGVGGLLREWRQRRWIVVWIAAGMLFLLLWPTKWPQYALVVLPAFCIAAAPSIRAVVHWVKEQQDYWGWFSTMFPRPTLVFWVALVGTLSLVFLGWIANTIYVGINHMGWSHMTAMVTSLPSNAINAVIPGQGNQMILATDGGVALWTPPSQNEILDNWVVYNRGNSGLPENRVLSAARDAGGDVWLGTQAGLARFDGEKWSTYTASDFGLSGDQVNALGMGSDGRLWIATDAGAAVFDGQDWKSYTSASGLMEDFVFSLAVDPHPGGDWIWFGSLSGLSRLDTATGEWKQFSSTQYDLGWGGISDLMVDSSSRLWISSLGGGLSVLDGETWEHYRVSNSGIPSNMVQNVFEAGPGEFWIATSFQNTSGGLVSWFDGKTWKNYTPDVTGYSGAETVSIAKDESGRIWFGTLTAGVDIYQPKQ